MVSLKETIKGFENLLKGELHHLPESAFYMSGLVEEERKPEKMNKLK